MNKMPRKTKKKIVISDLFSFYKNKNIKNAKFTFIDLFAGIGGIRTGFEDIGGECVFTSEWDRPAQKTYSVNFGEIPYGDITKINPEEIPSFDMLLAGFPCQPFSQAGLKRGFKDTRGTLFFDIAKIIKQHNPSVIFLENVRNLAGHDKGNTLKVITGTLEELGYKVFQKVLNAKNFGVPQNRARIYIIGFKDNVNFVFPKETMVKTKVWDILEREVDSKYTISDKLWAGHKRRKKEHKKRGHGFGYSLFDEKSEYTSTMSARYYKDGSEILIKQSGKNPRKITPREAARLQGFADDFIISVSDTQAYKQFGNSVAIPVIRILAKQIMLTLNGVPINNAVKK